MNFFKYILIFSLLIATSASSKKIWADEFNIEAFTVLIKNSVLEKGSYGMAEQLRTLALTDLNIEALRAVSLQRNGQKILEIPISLPVSELRYANRRLERSGIDFMHLVTEESSSSTPTTTKKSPLQARSLMKDLTMPTLVLTTAAVIGWLAMDATSAGTIGTSFWGEASTTRKISPYLVAGLVAALLEGQLSASKSFVSSWLLKPIGFWATRVSRDILYPLLVTSVGLFIAAFPPPQVYYPGFGLKTALAMTFSFLSQTALQGAFYVLARRGEIIRSTRYRWESRIALPLGISRVAFLSTESGVIGASIQGLFAIFGSVPLWAKLIFGDYFFDLRTKLLFEKREHRLGPVRSMCLRAIDNFARTYSFKRE